MAINLQRVNVKLYLEDEAGIAPDEAFRVFNRWISETTEEVLIDVADYTHIPQGPQTLLIGHEADYSLDNTDGRLGLKYGRKRPIEGETQQRFRDAIAKALSACQRLEQADETHGRAQFRGGDMQISIFDRLLAPNTEETLNGLRDDLLAVLSQVYPDAEIVLNRNEDDRQCLTVQIQAAGNFRVTDMLASLAA